MAFQQSQLHLLSSKVLPTSANQIVIPFHPLLTQIAVFLQFPYPLYHVLDFSKNNTYVSVKTSIRRTTFAYVGGPAATIEESYEFAARKVACDIANKWGLVIEDITFERQSLAQRCSRLHRLKCDELEYIIKEEDIGDLEEVVPCLYPRVRHLLLDYMPLLRKIFRTIAVQCTPLETLKHIIDRYISWITIQPLYNDAPKEVFIGPIYNTIASAKSCLAKKVVMYLIPAYKLLILDANYGSEDSVFATLVCGFEFESYLTIRERMTGIPDEPAYSGVLVEQDDLAIDYSTAHIQVLTVVPARQRTSTGFPLGYHSNMVVCREGPYPIVHKVSRRQIKLNRRARHAQRLG